MDIDAILNEHKRSMDNLKEKTQEMEKRLETLNNFEIVQIDRHKALRLRVENLEKKEEQQQQQEQKKDEEATTRHITEDFIPGVRTPLPIMISFSHDLLDRIEKASGKLGISFQDFVTVAINTQITEMDRLKKEEGEEGKK